MRAALVVLSLICALAGLVMLSKATAGVGLIAIGILFAILARLAQAADHQSAMQTTLHSLITTQTRELTTNDKGWLSSPNPADRNPTS